MYFIIIHVIINSMFEWAETSNITVKEIYFTCGHKSEILVRAYGNPLQLMLRFQC